MESHRLALQSTDCLQATVQTLLVLQLLSWSAARTSADARTEPRRVEENPRAPSRCRVDAVVGSFGGHDMLRKDDRLYVTVALDHTRGGHLRIMLPGNKHATVLRPVPQDEPSWPNRLHAALSKLYDQSQDSSSDAG